MADWPNQQSATLLKGRNEQVISSTPKGLNDHRSERALNCTLIELSPPSQHLSKLRKRLQESAQSWKKFVEMINLYRNDGEYREGKKQLVSWSITHYLPSMVEAVFIGSMAFASMAEGRESTNKEQLKMATVKAQHSISRKEKQHLVMSMGYRLQVVTDCKKIFIQLLKWIFSYLTFLQCCHTVVQYPKMWNYVSIRMAIIPKQLNLLN